MSGNKRISANYVRKFLPNLRRESTPEGRKWTVNGAIFFDTLQDVIEYFERRQEALAKIEGLKNINPLAFEEEKEVSDVAGI